MSLIIHIFRKVSAIHPSEKNIKDKTSVLVPIYHMKKVMTCLNYPERPVLKTRLSPSWLFLSCLTLVVKDCFDRFPDLKAEFYPCLSQF